MLNIERPIAHQSSITFFLIHSVYLSCKVLYFILSDDDFEIKSKNLQFQPASCFEAYLTFSRCLFSEFAFFFTFLNCRLVIVFFIYSNCTCIKM